jgi:hypothetical protein
LNSPSPSLRGAESDEAIQTISTEEFSGLLR